VIKYFIKEIRIYHWIKNLLLFVPLIFSKSFFVISTDIDIIIAFICFSFAASGIYIFNDILDLESDRQHPQKRNRPIASGKLPKNIAIGGMIILWIISVVMSFLFVNSKFFSIVVIYIIVNIVYSIILKHIVILDIIIVALGYVLRIFAGSYAISVPLSNWILITTMFISLFLAIGKRRYEFLYIPGDNKKHRQVLECYSKELLDQMIAISVTGTLMSYSLYTFLSSPTRKLMWTIPFVIYGLFRYMFLLYNKMGGARPERELFTDKPLMIDIALWTIVSILIIWR